MIRDTVFLETPDSRAMSLIVEALPDAAASVGVSPNAAADRFRALRAGMMDIHQRFTLDAQLALVRALRGRLN